MVVPFPLFTYSCQIQSTKSWAITTTSNLISPSKQILVNLQFYLSIELYSPFYMHFKVSTIIPFFLEQVLTDSTSLTHVVEVDFQIIITLTDHDKTIVKLFLSHQLILVSFLTSNNLLNRKVVRNYILTVLNQAHHHGFLLLVLFFFIFIFFSREEQGAIMKSRGINNSMIINLII